MLLEPGYLLAAPGLIAATLAVVLLGKPLIALVTVRVLGYPFRTALTIAIALGQIGEFSFILSTLGRELDILPAAATNTLVAASIVSIVVNPLLYRAIEPVDRWVAARPGAGAAAQSADRRAGSDRRAAETGRQPAPSRRRHRLRAHRPHRRQAAARQRGHADGGRAEPRHAARAARPGHRRRLWRRDPARHPGRRRRRQRRHADPDVGRHGEQQRGDPGRPRVEPGRASARPAAYLRDLDTLRQAGADSIYSGEGEVALAFTEDILESLGATAEQIDRERARAHDELFGDRQPRA